MDFLYLYRGVNEELDKKQQGKLIPKGKKLTIEGQAGESWMQAGEGVVCGESKYNAVIAHQHDSSTSNTAYISTSKNFDIAVRFATQDYRTNGYVYKLDVQKFETHGISFYDREEGCIGDEEEVTISPKDSSPIPDEVIVEKVFVTPKNT